jgi:Fe/S biogenesis protein NfuA
MENPIITLTQAGAAKIKSLQESQNRQGMAVRINVVEDGPAAFKYVLQFVAKEERAPDDEAVEEDGVVLYIDSESVPNIAGATLDFIDDFRAAGFKFDNPNKPPLLNDPLASRVHQLIEEQVNPGLAGHGGHVSLIDVKEGRVYVRLGGGCQGCGMVDVTLKQGIEEMLKREIPEITEVLDTTDHAAGTNPYYSPGE